MQTIGERLETSRQKLGLTIEEAASATKVRAEYLVSLEKSSGDDIPLPEIYVRGFIKNYAKFLKMEPSRLLADFDAPRRAHTQNPFHKTNKEVMGRLDITPKTPTVEKPKSSEPAATGTPLSTPKPTPAPAPMAKKLSDEPLFKPMEALEKEEVETVKPEPISTLKASQIKESPVEQVKEKLQEMPKWTLPTIISIISLLLLTTIGFSVASCSLDSKEKEAAAEVETPTIVTPLKLYASGNVTVIVRDAATNTTLYSGILAKGEEKTIPTTGDVQIRYSDGDLLEVEKGTKRYKLGGTGDGKRIIK